MAAVAPTRSQRRAGNYQLVGSINELPRDRKKRRARAPPPPPPEAAPAPQAQPVENFWPQPGDIIIRPIPNPSQLLPVLSVMGLIKIYADDYYFMYIDGQAHLLRFTFRSMDLIVRHGGFRDNRFYDWRDEDVAKLYMLYAPPGENATLWYQVATHINAFAVPDLTMPDLNTPYHGLDSDISNFSVLRGDFIIHKELAVAPDRPWGLSFQLRRATVNYVPAGLLAAENGNVEFGPSDVVIRVRMTTPGVYPLELSEEILDVLVNNAPEHFDDDYFVPMYVHGWLCLGGPYEQQDPGLPQPWNLYRWRYLGMDNEYFRNYQRREENFWIELKRFEQHPALIGNVVFNMWEKILPEGPRAWGRHSGGYCRIFLGPDDDMAPLDLPGTMILRLGYFLTPHDQNPPYEAGRRNNFNPELNLDTGMFMETPPELYVHDQLVNSRTAWVECDTATWLLPDMGILDREFPQDFQLEPMNEPVAPLSVLHIGDALQVNDVVFDVQPHVRDVVVSRNRNRAHILLASSRFQRAYVNTDLAQFETPISVVLERDDGESEVCLIDGYAERSYDCFYWYPNYEFQDGDCLIKYFLGRSELLVGRWIVTIEFFQCQNIPRIWKPDAQVVWIYKGQDTACIPSEDVEILPHDWDDWDDWINADNDGHEFEDDDDDDHDGDDDHDHDGDDDDDHDGDDYN